MIYEFRTYCMRPGGLTGFEARFGKAIAARETYSPLFAFWHTDTGRLDQAVHVWPYEDLNARMERRATAMQDPVWPPDTGEFIGGSMTSEIFLPTPYMDHGFTNPDRRYTLFDMRIETYRTRTLQPAVRAWGDVVERRQGLAPLVGCWFSEIGVTNRLLQVWAYESYDHRAEVLAQVSRDPGMQPTVGDSLIEQESRLLASAAFSRI